MRCLLSFFYFLSVLFFNAHGGEEPTKFTHTHTPAEPLRENGALGNFVFQHPLLPPRPLVLCVCRMCMCVGVVCMHVWGGCMCEGHTCQQLRVAGDPVD